MADLSLFAVILSLLEILAQSSQHLSHLQEYILCSLRVVYRSRSDGQFRIRRQITRRDDQCNGTDAEDLFGKSLQTLVRNASFVAFRV